MYIAAFKPAANTIKVTRSVLYDDAEVDELSCMKKLTYVPDPKEDLVDVAVVDRYYVVGWI